MPSMKMANPRIECHNGFIGGNWFQCGSIRWSISGKALSTTVMLPKWDPPKDWYAANAAISDQFRFPKSFPMKSKFQLIKIQIAFFITLERNWRKSSLQERTTSVSNWFALIKDQIQLEMSTASSRFYMFCHSLCKPLIKFALKIDRAYSSGQSDLWLAC